MNLLIRSGRIIDPESKTDILGDVLIENGHISQVAAKINPPPKTHIIEALGQVVAPGLIDLHVHLREPGREDEETVLSGSKAAVSGGFTTIAAMPNTNPVNDNKSICEFIINQAKKADLCRVLPVGAITRKLAGGELSDMGELKEAGAAAFSDDGNPVMNSALMRRAMEYVKMLDLPIISHCEELNLAKKGVMHEGLYSTMLGLAPIPAQAESIMVARDIALAQLTGARVHIAHVSTYESVELIREAKAKGIKITAEATPHHFTLTDKAVTGFDTNTKVNPPLRSSRDVAALIGGLQDNTIDAIASDHAPHSSAEKELEYTQAPFGLIGLETTLPLVITQLVNTGHLTLIQALEKLTLNPAKIMKIPHGRLSPGSPADITIFDLQRDVVISSETFHSKSRNTPFNGWHLKGSATITIVAGKIVYPFAS